VTLFRNQSTRAWRVLVIECEAMAMKKSERWRILLLTSMRTPMAGQP
jgi:hypothetical protein